MAVGGRGLRPDGKNMFIGDFIAQEYRPHVEATLAASTIDSQKKLWRGYGPYFAECDFSLRVCDAQKIMRRLASENSHLTKVSLRHIKTFMSGVFNHALRLGLAENNPFAGRAVAIPGGRESVETTAYSPEEANLMLSRLKGQAHLALHIALAAGLRKSEIRGLRPQDWHQDTRTLSVEQSVWRNVVKSTKTKSSRAPVPVAGHLAEELSAYIAEIKPKTFLLEAASGFALDLDYVARDIIRPALSETGATWRGWHAARRGLASHLHSIGVPDMETQKILRHSSVDTTRKCYIKVVPENVRKAMDNMAYGAGQ